MDHSNRFRHWFAAALVCLLSIGFSSRSSSQDQKKPDAKPPEILPAKLSGFSDSGVFHVYVNEEPLIRIDFTWKENGSYDGKSVLEFAGQKRTTNTAITVDKDGYWTTVEGTAQLGTKYKMEREADKVKCMGDKKEITVPLKAGALLFDDMSPALMSQGVRAYDQAKGGKQSFPMLVIPGAALDATLERKDTVERSVASKDLKLTRYQLGLNKVDLMIWADAAAKIYLIEVPAQKAAYVREGFELLRKVEVDDPLLSRPEFSIKVETNARVAMRDGVKLATDIYRPDKPGKHPAILIRTPYKKDMQALTGKFYARRGFVVAIQDCRGRFGSEGTWEPFVNEPRDGFDSVEWLAAQPWCTGKVGMIGASYGGWVQWWAAAEGPPHLVTIIPNVSPPDPFYNVPYEYGAFFLFGAAGWVDIVESGATADLSGETLKALGEKKYFKLLKTLPVIDLDKAILGKENAYWRKWIEHPTDDAYWQQADFHSRLDKVNIPIFHQSGWFDGDGIGSKLNYAKMVAHGHANQKLTLGPWGHTDVATRTHGKHDFGPQALRDLPRDYLRWFDYWLKGIDNGVLKEPLVSIFVMISNKWLHGPTYPLPQTKFEKWYLASAGNANTALGDGKLTREPPGKDSPPDRYSYDPGDPTPAPVLLEEDEKEPARKDKDKKDQASIYGRHHAPRDELSLIPFTIPGLFDGQVHHAERDAYHDQAQDQDKKAPKKDLHEEMAKTRRDMLVYVSEPMSEEYTFAGPISAVLYAASSAKDTDWFMRLMTVDPKGELFVLVSGKIRARFRESMSKPTLLEPGKVYEYMLDLWQTGINVPKGHRLRVEVASADFPMFSRNLNTGGHNEKDTNFVTAEQTIYHNAQYPSHVILPVIPGEGKSKK